LRFEIHTPCFSLECFLEGLEGFLEHLETILEGLKAHLTVSHE